jgi:hypothetical protein
VKLKAVLGALVVGALGAAVAFAAPPPGTPGKGLTKSTSTSTGTSASTTTTTVAAATTSTTSTNSHKQKNKPACVPQIAVVIFGTASSDAGGSSLSLNVTGGNKFAKLLFANNATTALTVNTTSSTQVTTSDGKASALSSIKKGDRTLVMYKACKSSVSGSSANVASASSLSSYLSSLTPKKVVARGQAS